jgi:hypothetical protein
VVHLFDKVTGKAITGAQVKMEYRPVTSGGEHAGSVSQVPVTEMRVIGQGPSTTHYGNNVSLNPGTYEVTIQANGTTAKFTIKV